VNCPRCGLRHPSGTVRCDCGYEFEQAGNEQHDRTDSSSAAQKTRQITETRCTCQACGHTWHYGKMEALEAAGAAMQNAGKAMMCCTGCVPALLIPDKKVTDLNKCPQCNSRAITKEQVTHDVK
jgi:DNA-directed RNA polymerase subunit RPC12/RpoP